MKVPLGPLPWLISIFLACVLPCCAQRYQVVDLGTFAGNDSVASAINAQRQVAGYGETLAFLWSEENGFQDLGTLDGDRSFAYGVNDSGQVVGSQPSPMTNVP